MKLSLKKKLLKKLQGKQLVRFDFQNQQEFEPPEDTATQEHWKMLKEEKNLSTHTEGPKQTEIMVREQFKQLVLSDSY